MDLHAQADALPTSAGVYIFKDSKSDVLYVGKANNLKARVKQYLQGHDERYMVRFLVAAATSVEVIPVHSEKEALLLEGTLIKKHQPPYNTRMRDHKSFLHIGIDPKARWPRFFLTRQVRTDSARYFGPYYSSHHARRILELLQLNFPLRTCNDQVLKSRSRPCLLHQMHRCVAPCVNLCTTVQYNQIINDAILFLSGRSRELVERLKNRMVTLAEEERFEEAARLRDLIKTLEESMDSQVVIDAKLGDRDAWGVYREADRGVLACLPVREGLVQDPRLVLFSGEIVDNPELLSSVLNNWYEQERIPPEILLPVELPDAAALEEVLGGRRGSAVKLVTPRRGDKVRVLEIAEESAKSRFQTTHSEDERRRLALEELANICGLALPPQRIECFDNSNLLGSDPVASQVVFIDGRPSRADYRRYKVKTVVGADDYATMREILGRRMKRACEEGRFPDLIVVDGGRGQLSAAEDVLRELGLEDQPVIGIAKPRTERKRGDMDAVDKIIVRGLPEPVVLRYDHPTLRMLQHLRDEAHDTAVEFHRKARSRTQITSVLDDIPGIGPTRRKALLTHFGSISAIKSATVEQLSEVVGPKVAGEVYQKFRQA